MKLNKFLTNLKEIFKDALPNGKSKRKAPKVERVYYVIVVHGIGEQKLNSTLTPVINRFAEVRQQQAHSDESPKASPSNMVTLGMVTSQTGAPYISDGKITFAEAQPWAEFKNIRSDGKILGRFDAKPGTDGDNIRFVEVYWADILNDNFALSGETLSVWSQAVLDRVACSELQKETWIFKILEQLRITLLFFYRMLSIQGRNIKQLVFDKFLGDVQIYGENPRVRAKAVARFHNLLEKLEQQHFERETQLGKKRLPRFIIIAHSLGSVLALDALVYGHLRQGLRRSFLSQHFLSLPFPSYEEEFLSHRWDDASKPKKHIGDHWIDHVYALVTLGSPIDKYLTLWPHNYDFLGKPEHKKSLIQRIFKDRKFNKIKHYNYCDEQDPVGDKLEQLRDRPVYQRLFEPVQEDFFNRYVIPVYAHLKYWTDTELFEKILVHTIDNPVKLDQEPDQREELPKPKDFPHSRGKYWKLIFNSYILIPLLSIAITTPLLLWGWFAAKQVNWVVAIFTIFANIQLTFILRKITGLSIWWRQILRLRVAKNEEQVKRQDAQLFILVIWAILGILVMLSLVYVPGSIHKLLNSADNWKDYQPELLYISGLVAISSVRLLFQQVLNFQRPGVPSINNLWQIAEFKNTVWFVALLGFCAYLGTLPIFNKYMLGDDYYYREVISWILLNATLTWIFVIVYFYDVRREIKRLNKRDSLMTE